VKKNLCPPKGPDSKNTKKGTSVPRSFVATEQKSPKRSLFSELSRFSLCCYHNPSLLLKQAKNHQFFEQNIFIFRSASIL
jgi:hypothetical protein